MSVCSVHCDKTADLIWMRFVVVGRMGPGIRQVVGFRDRSKGVILKANVRRPIVTID